MDLQPTHTDEETLVILGVDTHADVHVAVALDGLGRCLGHKSVPSTEAGYAMLVAWVEEFGTLERAGIEGSGSFGVGLARFLRARGVEVVEVNRPNRQHRRTFGKHRSSYEYIHTARGLGYRFEAKSRAEVGVESPE